MVGQWKRALWETTSGGEVKLFSLRGSFMFVVLRDDSIRGAFYIDILDTETGEINEYTVYNAFNMACNLGVGGILEGISYPVVCRPLDLALCPNIGKLYWRGWVYHCEPVEYCINMDNTTFRTKRYLYKDGTVLSRSGEHVDDMVVGRSSMFDFLRIAYMA